jgi:NUDIX domain
MPLCTREFSPHRSRHMSPWTVTASRMLFADRWLRVRADDCVTADGHVVKPFYVLDYPNWVNIVAITRDRHVIMIRQYRHGLGGTDFGLPAGNMDPTDTDPLAAAARELLEETGYSSANLRLVASLSPNTATPHKPSTRAKPSRSNWCRLTPSSNAHCPARSINPCTSPPCC